MSVLEENITIPKMDYQIISVNFTKAGSEFVLDSTDILYFTVRDSVYNENYIFQKKTGDGIVYNTITKKYDITIESKDTKDMDIKKKYGYDITVYFDGNKPKQQAVGNFILTNKYTLNEV